MKLGRTYEMTVEGVTAKHTVKYPITLTMGINRQILSSSSTGRFTLYNLSPDRRKDIYHDMYDCKASKDRPMQLVYKHVELKAGYESDGVLPVVFKGNIASAFSHRQGPDWLTTIDCWDGGFARANGDINISRPAGYGLKDCLNDLVAALAPTVARGIISSSFVGKLAKERIFSGNAWDELQAFIRDLGADPSQPNDAEAWIDLEKVNVMRRTDSLAGSSGLPVISAETGLLNTPRRQATLLEAEMEFEPRATLGMMAELQSKETYLNGDYKTMGVRHNGIISAVVSGDLTTRLNLWVGVKKFNPVT
ncbi:MAG: hypothetical protein NTY77_05670 [Elusimicrobia bacterium]|nr:hypothetical protein [Elusimicrobiota bacterium]